MTPRILPLALLFLPLALTADTNFESEVISSDLGGRATIADVDGDGFSDVVIHVWGSQRGKIADGKIIWYRYPDWAPTVVVDKRAFFGDMILAHDMDSDGDPDLLAAVGNDFVADLWWYENDGDGSNWKEHHFGLSGENSEIKDLDIHDMDGDGRFDVVSRLKKELVIWYQEEDGAYTRATQPIAEREGIGVADVDDDGDPDVVLNGFWLENTGERIGKWPRYDIDPRFFQRELQPEDSERWRDFSVRVQFADVDGDGKNNLILCHAEHQGFPVVWYTTQNPRGGPGAWAAHELGIVDFSHTLIAEDLDHNGHIDILAAGTRHDPESRITVFYNFGGGRFNQTTLAESGPVYAAAIGDIDNDGDLDLVSSYDWETAPTTLYRNTLVDHRAVDGWKRHLVDDELPYRAVFINSADLNGDSQPDLIAGGFWYEATGRLQYRRREIAEGFGNYYWHSDFDRDGDTDLFGLDGKPWGTKPMWAENDGEGNFTLHWNLDQAEGDFLQGVTELLDAKGRRLLVLSWHGKNDKTEAYVIPQNPAEEHWELIELAPFTLNEAIAATDVDQDGDQDIVLGNRWLEQRDGVWVARAFGRADPLDFEPHYTPDRISLDDFDGDGVLDVAIGLELGVDVLVYRNPYPIDAFRWPRQVIGNVPGMGFSLGSGDFDGDGDPDIVVGEHRGPKKVNNMYLFENADGTGERWRRHLIDRGYGERIDHHDGTVPVDLDGDGDLDLISVGWYNPRVWVFENLGKTLPSKSVVEAIEIIIKTPTSHRRVYETIIENCWLEAIAGAGESGFAPYEAIAVQEVSPEGEILEHNVPFQLFGSTPAFPLSANVTGIAILVDGDAGRKESTYRVVRGNIATTHDEYVQLMHPAFDAGVPAARIRNTTATWWYDLSGAGFSSLVDEDGNDWIGFAYGNGAAGEFRGIPNSGYPEGYMHPGKTLSRTEVVREGPLVTSLYSESKDGAWAGQWDFYPDRAQFTLLKASHPFWFLYEGTPGGSIEPDEDKWLRSDGSKGTLRESFESGEGNQSRDWIAFLDGSSERSLLLVNHRSSWKQNSYRLMDESMTVFGFGRTGMQSHMITTPRTFSVALVNDRSETTLRAQAETILSPSIIEVKAIRRAQD